MLGWLFPAALIRALGPIGRLVVNDLMSIGIVEYEELYRILGQLFFLVQISVDR